MNIISRSTCIPFLAQDEAVIRELVAHRNLPVKNQSLAEATMPPGSKVLRHYHRQTEEIYYILAGRGLMHLEGEEREVGPGDAIAILPGQVHGITTLGQTDLVLLAACSPGYELEDQVMLE
jgi:mannose-6-phosphate isomerase-like protein (cupin superfamily)